MSPSNEPPSDPRSLVLDAELHGRVAGLAQAVAVADAYGPMVVPRIARDALRVLADHARLTGGTTTG